MKTLFYIIFAAVMLVPVYSRAETISFVDPVGDHTGNVDVVGMDFIFDGAGAYTIDLTADGANPFIGEFRININLFNVSLNEYFQDTFNDFDFGAAQTSLTLSGTDANIGDWLSSHTIATSTLAGLGNPDGISLFRSSVADLPFSPLCQNEDVIGLNGCNPDLSAIPIPAAAWLFATALAGFIGISRRRRVS